MAKRFTDTGKWDQAWFRKLSPKMKCAWMVLCDRCDHAGIWEIDLETLSHFIGDDVSMDELNQFFGDKIQHLSASKLLIKAFIDFQYGDLNPANRVHLSIINRLKKEGASKPLISPLLGAKDKEEDKDKDKDLERGSGGKQKTHPLAEIWNQNCGTLPKTKGLSEKRIKAAKKVFSDLSPPDWIEVVRKISESNFCNGQNDRGWRADFDFLVRPDTWAKVLEGKYNTNVLPIAKKTVGFSGGGPDVF